LTHPQPPLRFGFPLKGARHPWGGPAGGASALMFRIWVCVFALFATTASALDFRSIADAPAILYGGPSLKTEKLYVASAGSPVEVITAIEGWAKVRTVGGEIAWAESAALAPRRTVAVVVPVAAIRSAAAEGAPVAGSARKGVVLEYLETSGAWARIRHRDGVQGFVRASEVWGL